MARNNNNPDYNRGYEEAIAAIKKALDGQGGSPNQSDQVDQQGRAQDGRDMDLSGTPAGDELSKANDGNSQMDPNQQGQSDGDGQQGDGGQGGNQGGGGGGSQSGMAGRGSGSQGVVTASDCAGQFGSNMPETPGGFMDPSEGGQLAEQEGYEGAPGGDPWKDWKDVAIQSSSKMQGKGAGTLRSKIAGIWKTTTDWKKSFRKIVGRALNTQDKRQAFANKNILATQSRIARTDKDKWDAVDYMVIFTDSSGSVSDDDLRYMLSEVYSIACQLKPEKLVLAQFDTKIQDVQKFSSVAEFNRYAKVATVKGRGGTDCSCCWELLKNDKQFKKSSAELVIIFTDGYLGQKRRDPKHMNNLCWAILDNPGWEIQNNDTKTSVVHLDTKKIR